jgi:hypothetical protein
MDLRLKRTEYTNKKSDGWSNFHNCPLCKLTENFKFYPKKVKAAIFRYALFGHLQAMKIKI